MDLKSCTLIGSDKGGVGKSMLAHLVIQAHDVAAGDVPGAQRIKVIEVDHQKRLSSLLGEKRVDVSLPASPSIEQAMSSRWSHESFYNPVYSAWASGDSITDLGANASSSLFDWARHNDIATFARDDGIAFRFVAVATPDDLALRSARAALAGAREAFGGELFLALNDPNGGEDGYAPYEGSEVYRGLLADVVSMGARVIQIPYCDCMLYAYAKARGYTVLDLLRNRDGVLSTIRAAANLDETTERFQVRRFTNWVRAVQTSISPIFEPAGFSKRASAA